MADPDAILAELVRLREELAGLRAEVLRRRRQGTQRARTRAKVVADAAVSYPVSELEVARMARQLSRRRR